MKLLHRHVVVMPHKRRLALVIEPRPFLFPFLYLRDADSDSSLYILAWRTVMSLRQSASLTAPVQNNRSIRPNKPSYILESSFGPKYEVRKMRETLGIP
jgi:hypothetical protein